MNIYKRKVQYLYNYEKVEEGEEEGNESELATKCSTDIRRLFRLA